MFFCVPRIFALDTILYKYKGAGSPQVKKNIPIHEYFVEKETKP